jgi:aryl-alcohol dehydrogenase-like predicted oxidoreductase
MASRFINEKTIQASKEYVKLAKELNISPVTLAVAWSKQFDFVASTIIGATKVSQLDESFKAMNLNLSNETLNKIKSIQNDIMYPMG